MKTALKLNEEQFASMGYRDLTLVRETADDGLFRARSPDGQAVLIKTQVQSESDSPASQRLEHEFSFAHELSPEHVVRPLKIERLDHSTALVIEDCGYLPLTDLLRSPLGIKTFLRIAVGITDALADIHQQGIVHRDLRPENIFVSEEGEAKLGGFGLASRVAREWYKPIQPEETTATLPYIAPEQTGRMNRSSDARSDLYSLGVVFYRMLTGKLPFAASDPLEWVYCHIAVPPKSPWEQLPTVPIALSELVMKLLAKAAEDRYQTAAGLKFDLRHCQQQWLESGATQPFKLGQLDIPPQLIIPEKLYGRKAEVKFLRDGLDRVITSGHVELLLVSGYSGVGKSALINEMHRSLVSSRAFFAEGKFDQYKQDTPYATFAQALQSLIRQIFGKREEEVAQWRDMLSHALQPNGRLVTDLVPDLELLIGQQPRVAEVPPQDAQNRFNHVMRRLIEVFARPEHPLVLFLDDLQWLDSASLQLLEHLLSRSGIKHLLLLGAYRDNEVGQDHPLRRSIEVLRERRVRVSEISLKPLRIDELRQLIADALNTNAGQVDPLAQLVYAKTGGNPFFVTQLLSSLAEENLVAFDPETSEWSWNLSAIHAKGYSENVVDLMLEKFSGLSDETQQALKQLACFGIGTEVDTLAGVFGRSETALHKALWGAVQAGLILRDKSSFRFLHDRVQEAAYALIPPRDRVQLHLEIGRQLVARSNPDELDDILFDAVDHFNRGAELISDPGEIIQLAELNAAAGRKALGSIAYAKARELFSTAAALLSDDAWVERYDFQFSFYSDWGQAEFLLGDHDRAEQIFSILLKRATNDLDLARVHRLRVTLYPIVGQYEKALIAGIEGLRLLDQVIPDDEDAIRRAIEHEAGMLENQLEKISIRDIPDAPEVTNERARILIDLLTGIAGPAYISRPELYPLFAYLNLNEVLRHGVTKEASHALSAYAVMEASSLGNLELAYESSQAAISLAERFGVPGALGSVLYLHGNHVNFWLHPFASDFPIMEKAFHACIDGGNLAFANYVGYSIVWQAVERGDALAGVLESSAEYAAFALESGNDPIRESIVLEQQFVRCLMGKTDGEISFSDDMIDEEVCVSVIERSAFLPGLAYYHTLKTLTAYLMGDNIAAQFHALEAGKYHPMVLSQPMQVMYHFLDALVLARGCKAADDEQRAQILPKIVEHERKLAFWAEHSPENFSCKHSLVAAELAVLQSEMLVAEQLFERACESARANRFVHWQAMSSEAAARFYLDRGLQTVARGYLRDARDCFARWGASAKTRQLEMDYLWLEPGLSSHPDLLNLQLDTEALLKASQQLSGEFDPAKLIKALMTLTLESGGADRGLLLLKRDRRFEVEVQATALGGEVQVEQLHTPINRNQCAESVINRVINTHRSILIDNVLQAGEFAADSYLQHTDAKCVCCIPLLRQDKLAGVLYLENSQTPGAFTHHRTAILDVLAAQAAVSIENAYLYQDLAASEAQYRDLVQTVQAAIVVHAADTRILAVNPMAQDLLGLSEAQLMGRSAIDPNWHFLREDGSVMPVAEYPVNQVLAISKALHNFVVGIDRPDRDAPVWALVSALPVFDEAHDIDRVVVSFSDITERKLAEQQLAANEQLFRTLVENSPDHIVRYDLKLRRIYVNPSLEKLFKVPLDQALNKTSKVNSPLLDPENYMANLRRVIDSGKEVADEIAFRTPQGELRWASSRFAPEFDRDGKVQSVMVISNDITGKKTAEFERQESMHFLESLDRLNCALQTEGDMEQIVNSALQEVLEIFDCDRVYLAYPCDPDAETWSIPMERNRPEYPGAGGQGPQPMEADMATITRALIDADQPLRIGPGGSYPVTPVAREQYHIRAVLATMLRPRVDKPWQFGIQQCSEERIWSDQEVRLFEEIGHRLSDALNSLLITRDLRASEERFRLVYENSPVSIWEEDFSAVKRRLEEIQTQTGDDLDGYLQANPELIDECAALVRIVNVNSATLALHEAVSKEELYAGLPNTFIPESYDAFRKELVAIAAGNNELMLDSAVQTLEGKRIEVSMSFAVCPGYEQTLSKVFVSMFDITQRKRDEDKLRLAASVFSTSQEGIMISDAENRIIDVNPAFTRLTGYGRAEAIGKNPRFLQSGRQSAEFYRELWRALEQRGKWQGEVWNQRKSGEIYPELLSIVAVKDEQDRLQHYVGAFSDISTIKEHEAELAHIAHYDVLTGLPNRRLLGDRLEQALAHARRTGKILAVCYLDLDGFKPINDRLGHEYGDQVLVEISTRLLSGSRGDDTVARLGGDEFVLLWNEIETQADCLGMIERILQSVSEPIEVQGESVTVSASIGVTQYPDDDVDADNLLRHADQAMYSAKQLGKNCYQMFDARLERQVVVRAEMLDRIRCALQEEQFELYYQPKLNYANGKLDGVEALLRWNDPTLGVLGAKEFLPPIEQDSLAYSVGQWVIERALNQAREWNDQGLTMPVSINLFPHHLNYRYFVRDLQKSVEACWPEMPRRRLVMEIVESTNLEEIESIDQIIGRCRKLGFEFSLDDFGTGYSSLIYLRRLSIEELKIDQSFVRDMLHDPNDEAIVRSVISLGKAFGLRVVAEGVETREHARHLVELGCPIVQGYALGRPMPAEAFEKWYADFVDKGLGDS